jgi:HK97 family phage major capsid protein
MTAVETRAMTAEEILAAMQALIETAQQEGDRDLTEDEQDRYQTLEAEYAAKVKSTEIQRRHAAYLTPVNGPVAARTTTADTDEAVERAFEVYLRTGVAQPELAQYRAQSAGTNTAGGYTVPAGFRQKLVERMKQYGGIAENVEVLNTSEGNLLNYPTIDDTANVGEIVAEGGTFAAGADLVFGTRTLSAYKYMAGGAGNLPLKVSWELLQDSAFDVAGFVARALGTRIARLQAVHWATGTGTGQPQGIVTPITTSGTIGTLGYGDLLATVNFLDPAYWPGAKWLMNQATWATIQGLTDTAGRPLINNATDGIGGTVGGASLLGFPVVIDQAMPSKATGAKFLAFGDLREAYVIRRVKEVTLVTLTELYAANGQTGFMAWARADGAVQNPNAIVVRTGA